MTTQTPVAPTSDCPDFDFAAIPLRHGSHSGDWHGECCAVELANRATVCMPELREKYGAAKTFTDDHPSISRVIRSFVMSLNDSLRSDEDRTRLLKPYVLKILGTKTGKKDDTTRAWMATDWLARVYTPAWLRLAGLTEEARLVEATARIVDAATARAAQPALDSARERADAAWAAAGAAAWAAAWAAAGDAAGAAAWDAAGAAARAAAWDAAGAAARAAAGDAAGAAAGAAAGEKLQPTVAELQASALDLLDRMCAVGREK